MKKLVFKNMRNVYLKPGEIFVSRTPTLVSTVLGSCVSVILYSPAASIGAMCHAQLPTGCPDDGFRYVDSTLVYMYDRLVAINGHPGGLRAKLFGGAHVLSAGGGMQGRPPTIGRQNVETALRVIEELGIPLTAADTGGEQGRKIIFNSGSGDVFVRPVRKIIR